MFGPYFIGLAENAAGPDDRVDVLGLSVAPGSLFFWLITITTIFSAVLLPFLGAVADRTANKKGLLAGFAWTGSAFAALIFFSTGRQLAARRRRDRAAATSASAPPACSTTRSCR